MRGRSYLYARKKNRYCKKCRSLIKNKPKFKKTAIVFITLFRPNPDFFDAQTDTKAVTVACRTRSNATRDVYLTRLITRLETIPVMSHSR